MLFNSVEFVLFFPLVCGMYFVLPHRGRTWLLLVASYIFYMGWEPAYALLIVLSTIVDYGCALQMEKREGSAKRLFLLLSLFTNLSLLGFFKYYNFVNENLAALAHTMGTDWPLGQSSWLLPVGISFYTFQTLSYSIDVYKGNLKPTRDFAKFALFVSFFPQLVAGPIERATHLLPQFDVYHSFDTQRIADGLRIMLWGLFKKVVVADRVSIIVDAIFDDPGHFTGPRLALATYLFIVQLFCDFSGYSDIAIGAAKVLGYDLMENFRQPLLSWNPSEYWSRWHISLIGWFRDYVYFPLGGSRGTALHVAGNIMVVWLLSGLWHGAGWNFVLWGVYNGVVLIAERLSRPWRKTLIASSGIDKRPFTFHVLSATATTLILLPGFAIFRSDGLNGVMQLFPSMFLGWESVFHPLVWQSIEDSTKLDQWALIFVLAIVVLSEIIEWFMRHRNDLPVLSRPLRWSLDWALLASMLLFGKFESAAFIYFQF